MKSHLSTNAFAGRAGARPSGRFKRGLQSHHPSSIPSPLSPRLHAPSTSRRRSAFPRRSGMNAALRLRRATVRHAATAVRNAGAVHQRLIRRPRPGARTSVRGNVHPQPEVASIPGFRDAAPASVSIPPIQKLPNRSAYPRFCGLKSARRPMDCGGSTPLWIPLAWHCGVVSFYEPDDGAPACSRLRPMSVNNTTPVEIQSCGTSAANRPATCRRSGSWPQFAFNRGSFSLPMNRMPIVAHGWQSRPTDGKRGRNQIGIRGSALPSVGILRGSWPVSRSPHGIQSAVQPAQSITLALFINATLN